MNWTSLHQHSHFSLLDCLSRPNQIVERCKELGYTSCAITDHGSISGVPAFAKALKDANMKPIFGCEFYVTPKLAIMKNDTENKYAHQVILAKNQAGWKELITLVSRSNDED